MKDEVVIGQQTTARAKLNLVPCSNPGCNAPHCPNHGYVVLELDGQHEVMGEVRTRVEAWEHLQAFKKAPGVSPQPEFLQAARQADWLSGEMPSALFTCAGARQGSNPGTVKLVPMDAQVVNGLLRARGNTPAEDRARMNRVKEVFGR